MTPDTEALRELTRLALAVEDPPSAVQLRAIRALADAVPALLATVEAQREEIAELRDEVQDWRDNAEQAAGELCGTERHCSCVGLIRRNWNESLELLGKACNERDALKAEVERLRAALDSVGRWTLRYGASLCPSGYADSYGEGVRKSKGEVRALLYGPAALRGEEASRE